MSFISSIKKDGENVGDLPMQQERKVNGTVKDGEGIPLPGVTVLVKGTTRGTYSCLDKAPVYVISSPAISPLCWHSSNSPVIGNQGGKGWCHKSSFHLAVSHSSEPCLDINPRKLLANFTNKNFQTSSNVYVGHIQERRSLNLGTLMFR